MCLGLLDPLAGARSSSTTIGVSRRVLGDDHPDTLHTMNNLAIVYRRQGRYEESVPLYVETLQIMKRVLGEEHPSTLFSINNLADLYHTGPVRGSGHFVSSGRGGGS